MSIRAFALSLGGSGGSGGSGITGSGSPGQIAFFSGSSTNIGSSDGLTWDAVNRIFKAGNPVLDANKTVLTVDDQNKLVRSNGIITNYGSVVFSGSGIDDFTYSGVYNSNIPHTYIIRIDSNGSISTGVITGTIQPGNTITGGTSGATADVVGFFSGPNRFFFKNLVGVFVNGETITSSLGGTAVISSVANQTTDTFSNNVNVDLFVVMTGANQNLGFGIQGIFQAITGHTLNDNWTFTVTPNSGVGFIADYGNERFAIGSFKHKNVPLSTYANDAAAGAAGLVSGDLYQQTATGVVLIKQ